MRPIVEWVQFAAASAILAALVVCAVRRPRLRGGILLLAALFAGLAVCELDGATGLLFGHLGRLVMLGVVVASAAVVSYAWRDTVREGLGVLRFSGGWPLLAVGLVLRLVFSRAVRYGRLWMSEALSADAAHVVRSVAEEGMEFASYLVLLAWAAWFVAEVLKRERWPQIQGFAVDSLRQVVEDGFGIEVATLDRLPGHSHSLNFRVRTADGTPFVVKCLRRDAGRRLRRIVAHAGSLKGDCVPSVLFGGKMLDFGDYAVLALRWIGGERRSCDRLSFGEATSLVRAYATFQRSLRDDGEVLPALDYVAMRERLLELIDRHAARELRQELKGMRPTYLRHDPAATGVIHGDLNYGNLHFSNGAVTGFLDIEELRFGCPTEDLVRYVVCSAEHLQWYEFRSTAAVLRRFADIVRNTGYSVGEWMLAIDGYLLRKLEKKIDSPRPSLWQRLNLHWRLKLYRRLREIVNDEGRRVAGPRNGEIAVKVVGGSTRRFLGPDGATCGRCRFITDPACQDYDWLAVYDEFPRRAGMPELRGGRLRLRCPKAHTVLLTQEPVSVKRYNPAYVGQFAHFISNRPPAADRHPRHRRGIGYMVWYLGRTYAETLAWKPPEKTKLISAVCSGKRMRHTRHKDRWLMMNALKQRIPSLDWFGKGVRELAAKYDALDDYRYHVAVENHIAPGHWTEKIADPLLSECLTFYAGDPDLGKVLPPESFIPIPIDDPDEAARIIEHAIADGEYERRLPAIRAARRLLLEKYNFCRQLADLVEEESAKPCSQPSGAEYLSTRARTRLDPRIALGDFWWHLRRHLV